jgi:hypothetical protein
MRREDGKGVIVKDFTILSIASAFSFPFADRAWPQKLALAGAFLLVPIFGVVALSGWQLEILRRVLRQEADRLPDWEDLPAMLRQGFQVSLLTSVLLLPFLIVGIGALAIPGAQSSASEAPLSAASVLSACLSMFALTYLVLAAAFIGPASLGMLAETGSVSQALRPHAWLRLIAAAPGPFLTAFVGAAGAALVGLLGYLACLVGSLFTGAYAYAVVAHLYGQAHRAARARLSPPA